MTKNSVDLNREEFSPWLSELRKASDLLLHECQTYVSKSQVQRVAKEPLDGILCMGKRGSFFSTSFVSCKKYVTITCECIYLGQSLWKLVFLTCTVVTASKIK